MGSPSSGPAVFKIVATVSAIFAIGVIAVSGALLTQAIRYRDQFFYGAGYGGYNSPDYYYGGGNRGYYQSGYGGGGANGYYGAGAAGFQDVGYDVYRYQKVIAISAIALGAGIIQFLVSMLLCCINEDNVKGLSVGYVAGSLVLFIIIVACFGLAFQYRVIYPFYFYNYFQYQSYYNYNYNPEGQAFCAILGIDLIYIIISAIVAGVFAKRGVNYDDRVEWHVRPTSASPNAPHNAEYRS